jgi:hypothetical protein
MSESRFNVDATSGEGVICLAFVLPITQGLHQGAQGTQGPARS